MLYVVRTIYSKTSNWTVFIILPYSTVTLSAPQNSDNRWLTYNKDVVKLFGRTWHCNNCIIRNMASHKNNWCSLHKLLKESSNHTQMYRQGCTSQVRPNTESSQICSKIKMRNLCCFCLASSIPNPVIRLPRTVNTYCCDITGDCDVTGAM